ncbi:MAG: hypothetical protein R3B57_03505 [Phycisphaerales bacterium]
MNADPPSRGVMAPAKIRINRVVVRGGGPHDAGFLRARLAPEVQAQLAGARPSPGVVGIVARRIVEASRNPGAVRGAPAGASSTEGER